MAELCYGCGRKMPKRMTKTCDECGGKWSDGIDGCPHCGDGNPFKGIECLTSRPAPTEASQKDTPND